MNPINPSGSSADTARGVGGAAVRDLVGHVVPDDHSPTNPTHPMHPSSSSAGGAESAAATAGGAGSAAVRDWMGARLDDYMCTYVTISIICLYLYARYLIV